MMSMPKMFNIEIKNGTLVVMPQRTVGSFSDEHVKPELDSLLEQLQQPEVQNVVIDLSKVAYFGTIMLGAMHLIWRRVRESKGKMALCNVSNVGREVLRVSGFDTLWPLCSSREEAVECVQQEQGSPRNS